MTIGRANKVVNSNGIPMCVLRTTRKIVIHLSSPFRKLIANANWTVLKRHKICIFFFFCDTIETFNKCAIVIVNNVMNSTAQHTHNGRFKNFIFNFMGGNCIGNEIVASFQSNCIHSFHFHSIAFIHFLSCDKAVLLLWTYTRTYIKPFIAYFGKRTSMVWNVRAVHVQIRF